ncbi:MAG: hypothetical protein QM747_17135 [Nocardioides sp.]
MSAHFMLDEHAIHAREYRVGSSQDLRRVAADAVAAVAFLEAMPAQ